MALLIRGGRVALGDRVVEADVLCEGERIARVDRTIDPASLPGGGEVIDAAGRFVLPGFVDPHVHVHLPFMGTFAKDDWTTASRAALLGGTTALVEMICPGRDEEPWSAFEHWRGLARRDAACDHSFHMGITRFDELARDQLRAVVEDGGLTSFKVFLAYKGALGIDDAELYGAMGLARSLGCLVAAHCENETLVAERQAELLAAGRTGPEWHEPSRPPVVEAEGVHHFASFLELTGAAGYVVHTSCAEALDEATRARDRGVDLAVEVVAPHLVLDRSLAERPDFEGAKWVMSPPLREPRHLDALWAGLRAGRVATVGTDHAPFDFEGQKTLGRSDFTKIPNGLPSVQHRIELLWTHGVATGRIDVPTLVEVAAAAPARLLGLRGKGAIAPGMDADLVIWDPAHRGTISASTHAMATDHSAFEGMAIEGRASLVARRGTVVVRDGVLVDEAVAPGTGRAIERSRPRSPRP